MSMIDAIHPATSSVAAAGASFVGTLSVAAGAAPIPAEVPGWLPYLATILGPVLVLLAGRAVGAFAASKRSLAASQDRRAKLLLADKNPANDAEAHELEDKADANRAIADAAEALRQSKTGQ